MIPIYQNVGEKLFSYGNRKQTGETFLLFWALNIHIVVQ
jgi:hypothetical protein